MAASYQLWVYDTFGNRRAVIEDLEQLTYVLSVNVVGVMTATFPREAIDQDLLQEDTQFEVWRRPEDGIPWHLEGETRFLLQSDVDGLSEAGDSYRTVTAESALTLLSRRTVNAYAGSAGALKTGPADDVMKAYVTQEFGASAGNNSWTELPSLASRTVSRVWSAYLTVEGNKTQGATIIKDASKLEVLKACQDIAANAANLVPIWPLAFDVVWTGTMFEFRTYAAGRGVDRTGAANGLLISPELGTLGGKVELTRDWGGSKSFVRAYGAGQQVDQLVNGYGDYTRITTTPFGLREGVANATGITTAPPLINEASSEVDRQRPTRTLTGDLLSGGTARYGIDWGWGDAVIAVYRDMQFRAHADQLTVALSGGQEKVTAKVIAEGVL